MIKEWLGIHCGIYRLIREGNHAIKVLVGWETREDSRESRFVVLEQV